MSLSWVAAVSQPGGAGPEERPLTHQSHSSQKNKAFTEHGDKVVNFVLITNDVT